MKSFPTIIALPSPLKVEWVISTAPAAVEWFVLFSVCQKLIGLRYSSTVVYQPGGSEVTILVVANTYSHFETLYK